jgi:methyl-accepting chemotaxis protein
MSDSKTKARGFGLKLGLSTKIIGACVLILIVVVSVNYVIFMRGYRASAMRAMGDRASAFTAVADATKSSAAEKFVLGEVNTDRMLTEALAQIDNGAHYAETRYFQSIPVIVGWQAGAAAAEKEHMDFNVVSLEARNPDNQPADGSFKHQMLTELTTQYKSNGTQTIQRVNEETNTLHYMRAITLDESCMTCHGDPAKYDERDENGKYDGLDALGFRYENWPVGYMHGAYEIALPLNMVDAQVAGFFQKGMMFTIPLIIVAAGLVVVLLRYLLTKPLGSLVERFRDIAEGEGDLTMRVDESRGDEIGELGKWFNTFVTRVHDLIVSFAGAAQEVAGASREIAASAGQMSCGMKEQNDQITQVSAAVEQMSASIVGVADNSAEAVKSAVESGETANHGGEIVTETLERMKSISQAVNSSSESVTELGKRGDQIGEIIGVINDIADQTNLLALNAAIEAARAGEHGRGFAVVADEVRKLAERTTQATEEVSCSIREIQSETSKAVEMMQSGTKEVDDGVRRASAAGESLQRIVSSALDVRHKIESIAATAEEQSSVATEISQSIQRVSATSAQVAEGTAQSALAGEQLSMKAEQLMNLIGKFKIKVSDRCDEDLGPPYGTEERRFSAKNKLIKN